MPIIGDFETRSACDLRKAGAYAYSQHPTTQVLCFCWQYSDDPLEDVHIWHRAHPDLGIDQSPFPTELAERVAAGEVFEAHNAFFEFSVWNNVFRLEVPGLPELKLEQMKCSAAKAASFSLPRGLDAAISALGLPQKKDIEGSAAMMRLTKPRKLKVAEKKALRAQGIDPDTTVLFNENEDDIRTNWAYCQQDVRAEHGLSSVLRDLTPQEFQYWQMDQRMNLRGVYVDLRAVHVAVKMASAETDRINGLISKLTEGFVPKSTGRAKLKVWCHDNGVPIPNTQAATIDAILGFEAEDVENDEDDEAPVEEASVVTVDLPNGLPDIVRTVLALARDANRSSLAKYKQMLIQVSDNSRLRDMMLYCGASRTGRWCVPGTYEVLTREGWATFENWSSGEIAQWSPDGSVEFKFAGKVEFEAPKTLKGLRSDHYINIQATDEHNWPTLGYYKGAKLKTRSHKSLTEGSRANMKLPVSGVFSEGRALTALDRVKLMTQADGCISKRPYHTALIWEFSKARKTERCRSLLTEAGIPFKEYQKASGETAFVHNNPTEELKASKFLGPWVLEVNPREALDEIALWDGSLYKTHMAYSSVLKVNADWVQTLAHLAGRAARVTLDTKREGQQNPIWRVNVRNSSHIVLTNTEVFEEPSLTPKVYCASTATGFFLMRANGQIVVSGNSGKGVQPHNFIRGYSKQMEEVWQDILQEDPEILRLLWPSVMEVLSKATRGAMTATPGKDLMVADFAAIEARVLMWLAMDDEALGVFYREEDIYLEMASAIYGYPCNKKEHPFERQVGKQAILGLGYQMGAEKFMDTCHKYPELRGLKLDFLEDVVKVYRKEKFPNIVSFWKDLNDAVIEAVEAYNPKTMRRGPTITCRRVKCFMWGQFLHIELPSGRLLSYYRPQIKSKVSWRFPATREDGEKSWALATMELGMSEDQALRVAIKAAKLANKTIVPGGRPIVFTNKVMSFWHEDSKTRQWKRKATYGGELVENCLAGDTEVLTDCGWKPLVEVGLRDKVWDGLDWVSHLGLIYKKRQHTMAVNGVRMTSDHKVLTSQGWKHASQSQGLDRASLRKAHSESLSRKRWPKVSVAVRVFLRGLYSQVANRGSKTSQERGSSRLWVFPRGSSQAQRVSPERQPSFQRLAGYGSSVLQSEGSSLSQLWSSRYFSLRGLAKRLRPVYERYVHELQAGVDPRAGKQRSRLFSRELYLGHSKRPSIEQEKQPRAGYFDNFPENRHLEIHSVLSLEAEPVYDLLNAGPRSRFLVRAPGGQQPGIIVHNCTQAVARDLMAAAMLRVDEDPQYDILLSVHDELIAECDEGTGDVKEFEDLMAALPDWAEGCPVAAEGWRGKRYRK